MKVLIHDYEGDISKLVQFDSETKVITNSASIHNCIGCFGCWIKTPGECIIHDDFSDLGKTLSECEELIVISKCYYGGFSPFVKNVFDRGISYNHPYFEIRNGEMHHKRRYDNKIDLQVIFYGNNITDKEKQTASKLVEANSINLDCKSHNLAFINDFKNREVVEV